MLALTDFSLNYIYPVKSRGAKNHSLSSAPSQPPPGNSHVHDMLSMTSSLFEEDNVIDWLENQACNLEGLRFISLALFNFLATLYKEPTGQYLLSLGFITCCSLINLELTHPFPRKKMSSGSQRHFMEDTKFKNVHVWLMWTNKAQRQTSLPTSINRLWQFLIVLADWNSIYRVTLKLQSENVGFEAQ